MNIRIVATLASVALFSTGNVFAQASVDENLPAYEKTSGVSGNLSSIGSDTLANLMTLSLATSSSTRILRVLAG